MNVAGIWFNFNCVRFDLVTVSDDGGDLKDSFIWSLQSVAIAVKAALTQCGAVIESNKNRINSKATVFSARGDQPILPLLES